MRSLKMELEFRVGPTSGCTDSCATRTRVGYDIETITANVTNGSPDVTSVMPNAFITRAGRDVVESALLPDGTIVKRKNSNSQMTLSTPWPGPSGIADLIFHHDLHNYCVQFEMPVQ